MLDAIIDYNFYKELIIQSIWIKNINLLGSKMNQGVFFGQIVIGPAGSGKVPIKISNLVNILQAHAINGLNLT